MKCNALLIYPPDREECLAPAVPPLGLAYLSAFARRRLGDDCRISIWDLNLNRVDKEEFKKRLFGLDEKPDVIGIGGIVTVFKHFLWMSRLCRDIFPDSVLLAGGSLGSTVPNLLFKHSPVDVCVKGEGEFTFVEIIKKIMDGASTKDMAHINGLYLWDSGKDSLIETPSRSRTPDLDVFGMPDYDQLDIGRYAVNGIKNLVSGYAREFPSEVFSQGNLSMVVMTSRGCSNRCTFCYRQFSKIGMNSPEFVKNHILFLHDRFGINIFSIMDELFNITEERVSQLRSLFMEIKKKIPSFYFRITAARADRMSVKLLKELKDAGCIQIIYGLESGSEKMLKMMKKNVTVEENRKAVIAARDAGINCVPQFVIGMPGENRQTLAETVKFIKSIDFWSTLSIHKANAYPGSEIYEYAREKGLIKDEFSYVSNLASTNQYPIQLADVSLDEMRKILRKYLIEREIRLIFKRNNFAIAIFILTAWVVNNFCRIMKNSIKNRPRKND